MVPYGTGPFCTSLGASVRAGAIWDGSVLHVSWRFSSRVRQFHPAQLSHAPGTTVSSRNSGGFRTQTPPSGGFRTLRGLRASDCRPRSQLASKSGPKARRASECRPAAPVMSEPRPAARRATTSRQKVRNRTRFYRAAAKSPAPRGHRASHASGASDRNRTRNPLITNQLLYR